MPAPLEPRANSTLVGQEPAVAILREAWHSGRMPHAWLLAGPRGVGKATLAYRLARALLAGPNRVDPCLGMPEDDPVFRQVAAAAHPDLNALELPRDPRSGRLKGEIPVDAVRRATATLHTTAAMGGSRVVLVDGAEWLNRSAANALLKPLEEPPPGALLILISHQPMRVMPTLRSRCARLRLGALDEPSLDTILARQRPDLDEQDRLALARLARGSPGRALELAAGDALKLYRRMLAVLGAEPPDGIGQHALAAELARYGEGRDLSAPLALVQELLGRAVAVGAGRLPAPLFRGEIEALRRLADRGALDRWPGLWEKIAQLADRADSVNLDRFHVLLHILIQLAPAGERAGQGSLDGARHGGLYVFG